MKIIKKGFGIICMLIAPVLIFMMFRQFFAEIPALETAIAAGKKPASEMQSTYIFWIITITIFVPIASGLCLFGYYAFQNEYSNIEGGQV